MSGRDSTWATAREPMCAGSGVMCLVKRGTLRSGDDEMKQKNDEIRLND